jgi:hypothetical protein
MEAIKDLVSTRFGIIIVAMYLISTMAEGNPAIVRECVYTIGFLALAHVISRTIRGGGNGTTAKL